MSINTAMSNKKSIDLTNSEIDIKNLKLTDSLQIQGIAGDPLAEPIPEYIQTPCETVIGGKGDAYIIFGRDRPSHRTSGYGGIGHTKANSIDVVVGRLGSEGKPQDDQGKPLFVEPDFAKDACRIHVSEKTDIDDNFNLVAGKIGKVKGQSGVGIKAESIRVVARSGGIKLVTDASGTNSRGSEIPEIKGIELIAGNDDSKLQPIPLGTNLITMLESMITEQENMISVLDTFITIQTQLNKVLGEHWHYSPFFGKPTTPSEDGLIGSIKAMTETITKCKKDLSVLKMNLANLKGTYTSSAGSSYILSRLNSSN